MLLVLSLQAACATSYPMGGTLTGTARRWQRGGEAQGAAAVWSEGSSEDQVLANLRRAAKLPWTDGGRCVVEEASQPWPVLAERCYQVLDHERVRFNERTGRCAVASAGAGAVGVGLCVLAAPEIIVGAIVVAGVVVVGLAISEALEAYEKRGRPQVRPPPSRPPPSRPVPETRPVPEARPVTETKPVPQQLKKKRRPKPEPEGEGGRPPLPPEPTDRERNRRCEAMPVPHSGGNKAHNTCADWYPPNRWPGMDARVDGRDFDALQVGVRVLWEIKVEKFDEYSDFLKKITVAKEMREFTKYRDIALACGYAFKVGVISEAHKAALLKEDASFDIVVTGCK
ncbi:DUF6310 domain-containing protein [Archangium gephyra]|uniref:DUF6310 domain-containing protein n=1 Tax=Archangium gephyra TaxID=48 RepID=UPI003B7E9315